MPPIMCEDKICIAPILQSYVLNQGYKYLINRNNYSDIFRTGTTLEKRRPKEVNYC